MVEEEVEVVHVVAALLCVLNAAAKKCEASSHLQAGRPGREKWSKPVSDRGKRNGTPQALEHGLEGFVATGKPGQEGLAVKEAQAREWPSNMQDTHQLLHHGEKLLLEDRCELVSTAYVHQKITNFPVD